MGEKLRMTFGKCGARWRKRRLRHSLFAVFVLFLFFFFAPSRAFAASAEPEPAPRSVTLDAARVSYEDEAGRVYAEGGAVLSYQNATIQAERIDYDVATQTVKAMPLPGGFVKLSDADRVLTSNGLEYNLNTGEGILYGAKTAVSLDGAAGDTLEGGTLYLAGGRAQVLPYGLAVERGLVKKGSAEGYAGIWEDVSATTCALDHPHYRIETKRIIFFPGQRLVAKKPRLYLGNTLVLAYPLDYIAQIDRKALKRAIIPYIQASGEKGIGAGLDGALSWQTGFLNLGLSSWSGVGIEWMAGIEQTFGEDFSVTGQVTYSWDKAWAEKIYHPSAALLYERAGWRAALRWSKNEYIEDRKDFLYEYQGRLDRKPEFEVFTPWKRSPFWWMSHFQLGLTGGVYREKTPEFTGGFIARYGATLRTYTETPLSPAVDFFWNMRYGAWFYDKENANQEMIESILGLRYKLGALELTSGYERRRAWGESPFLWDGYRGAEKLHQKIRLPLGREVYATVRGSYDLKESKVDETHYALQWINDCMKWELAYHDSRAVGAENRAGFSLSLLAFPNTPAAFGEYKDTDPFERPRDLSGSDLYGSSEAR